jgi:hypothetical protein
MGHEQVTYPVLILALCLSAPPGGAAGPHARDALIETPGPYILALDASLPLLPEALEEFFRQHRDSVQQRLIILVDPDNGRAERDLPPNACFVKLDIARKNPDAPPDERSARSFPSQRQAAVKHFAAAKERDGGVLPWQLQEEVGRLTAAFRRGEPTEIVRRAAHVLHLSCDASMPFNTTWDSWGLAGGGETWAVERGSAAEVHRTPRGRCQCALIEVQRERFAHEVRIAPARARPMRDPLEETFAVLFRAHESLAILKDADAALRDVLGISDRRSFLVVHDAYYQGLMDRAGWVIEARIEDGALLAARLWSYAWTEAGMPPPGLFVAAAPAGSADMDEGDPGSEAGAGESTAPSAATTDEFVGSRNSTVFHRAACQHVNRISAGNRVWFPSAEEAVRSGRKPCKVCLPADPASGSP